MSQANTERLLVLVTLHPRTAAESGELCKLVSGRGDDSIDWKLFFQLAKLNKVEPIAVQALKAEGVWNSVESSTGSELEKIAENVLVINRARHQKAVQLFERLNSENIPVCLLKGILFSQWIYQNVGYKRMNDVDMLFKKSDLSRLPKIYEELNYFALGERVGKNSKVQTKVSHHLPPYFSRDLSCVLGSQWGLKSPLLGYRIDYSGIWKRSEEMLFDQVPVRRMSPTDNLFHICIHLGFFKTGLRDVMDIYNLIRAQKSHLDKKLFIKLVNDSGAHDLVFHSLSLANELSVSEFATFALKSIKKQVSAEMIRAVKKKTASLAVQLRLCSGYLSEIEKSITRFNEVNSPNKKWAEFVEFWRLMLIPGEDEAKRIALDPFASGINLIEARLFAPVNILKAISREVGPILLGGLIAKGFIDIVRVSVNPLNWTKSSDDKIEERYGLTEEQFERLKNAIF